MGSPECSKTCDSDTSLGSPVGRTNSRQDHLSQVRSGRSPVHVVKRPTALATPANLRDQLLRCTIFCIRKLTRRMVPMVGIALIPSCIQCMSNVYESIDEGEVGWR